MENKKRTPKKLVAISIRPEVWTEFMEYCQDNDRSGSALIQEMVKEFLKNNK
jgi:hypothetical protein